MNLAQKIITQKKMLRVAIQHAKKKGFHADKWKVLARDRKRVLRWLEDERNKQDARDRIARLQITKSVLRRLNNYEVRT